MKKVFGLLCMSSLLSIYCNAGLIEYGKDKATEGFKNKLKDRAKTEYIEHRKMQRETEGANKSRLTRTEDTLINTKDKVYSKGREVIGQENINKINRVKKFKDEKVGQFKNKIKEDATETFGEDTVNRAVNLKKVKDRKESELADKTIQKGKQMLLGNRIQ